MENGDIVFEGIVEAILGKIPELKIRIEKEFAHYYDLKAELPEAYPVFEDTIHELLLELIVTRSDDELMKRIFQFMERMANSSDRNVTDLLGIAIIEPLVYHPDKIRAAWDLMGKGTKERARETARDGHWEQNLPAGEALPATGTEP
jgi:hypothetical protein